MVSELPASVSGTILPSKNPRYAGLFASAAAQVGALVAGFIAMGNAELAYRPEFALGFNVIGAIKAAFDDGAYAKQLRKNKCSIAAKEARKAVWSDIANAAISLIPAIETLLTPEHMTRITTWALVAPVICRLSVYSTEKIAEAREVELKTKFYSYEDSRGDMKTSEMHELQAILYKQHARLRARNAPPGRIRHDEKQINAVSRQLVNRQAAGIR
jgi:hypothetical protein